jgi:5'-deoxynucleotidase YfbR-like HD superfamily hydrolase
VRYEGYRKIQASELPRQEQERLRRALQHDLAEALIKEIKTVPPEIDLSEVELVLKPEQDIADWDAVADCITCLTCVTCGTCGTT